MEESLDCPIRSRSDTGADTPKAETLTCSVAQGNSIASQDPELAMLFEKAAVVWHRGADGDISMN